MFKRFIEGLSCVSTPREKKVLSEEKKPSGKKTNAMPSKKITIKLPGQECNQNGTQVSLGKKPAVKPSEPAFTGTPIQEKPNRIWNRTAIRPKTVPPVPKTTKKDPKKIQKSSSATNGPKQAPRKELKKWTMKQAKMPEEFFEVTVHFCDSEHIPNFKKAEGNYTMKNASSNRALDRLERPPKNIPKIVKVPSPQSQKKETSFRRTCHLLGEFLKATEEYEKEENKKQKKRAPRPKSANRNGSKIAKDPLDEIKPVGSNTSVASTVSELDLDWFTHENLKKTPPWRQRQPEGGDGSPWVDRRTYDIVKVKKHNGLDDESDSEGDGQTTQEEDGSNY